MNREKIGIVGIKGRFGSWFERFFMKRGFRVKGTDIGTRVTLERLVRWADVVIVCVPIPQAPKVIKKGLRFSNPRQLWIDITSIKEPSTRVLERKNVEFVTLHPLFAPGNRIDWRGESAAIGFSRIDRWLDWFNKMNQWLRAALVRAGTNIHDRHMLGDQNLPHICAFAQIAACEKLGLNPKLLLALSTKVSRKQFAIAARILSLDPELYADIQLGNKGSVAALDALIASLSAFRSLVARRNKKKFVSEVRRLRSYLGDDFLEEALKCFK